MRSRTAPGLLHVAIVALCVGCIVLRGYDFQDYSVAVRADASDASPSPAADSGGCVPLTCHDLGAECGKVPNRCEGVLDCGSC